MESATIPVMRLLLVLAAAAPLFAQSCPTSLAPSTSQVAIPAVSSTSTITVHAQPDCTWTYRTDSSAWITFTPALPTGTGTGTGPGTIYWSASANVVPSPRQAKIIVTGASGNVLTLIIAQAAPVCALTLSQPPASFGVYGGNGFFQVQANCTWSAYAQGWITVPSNTGGTANGAVNYTVAANPCATQRSGAVSVTSYALSQQFQITQDGAPGNFSISPSSAMVPPAGVNPGTVNVTTGDGCPWSAFVDATWITILSGSSSTGSGRITYSVPANTGPQRVGHINVQQGLQVFTVTQQALPPPAMQLNAVVSAASYVGGAVSPGEIVALFGANIGPTSPVSLQLSADGASITKSLGSTQVLFDGVPAALTYASANQVNAVAPYSLAGSSKTQVQVQYQGVLSNSVSVPVQAAHPGIFTVDSSGLGGGSILNQDYSLNNGTNAAARKSVVMIYCTGGGVTNPPRVDAAITPAPPPLFLLTTQLVSVTIGGTSATVSYSGGAPGYVAGLTQINAQVPAGVTPGTNLSIIVQIGNWQSQPGVTIAVK